MCSLYSSRLLPPRPCCIHFSLQYVICCHGLVRKLLPGPELPKVACPGLQIAEEALGDAAVIVIAVPCPHNEALPWPKRSDHVPRPRNEAPRGRNTKITSLVHEMKLFRGRNTRITPHVHTIKALPWPKRSNHVTRPRNEAPPWPKHSNHVPRPRAQPFSWTEFFRFDMLRPPLLLRVNLRYQWGDKCYHGPGIVQCSMVRVEKRAMVRR